MSVWDELEQEDQAAPAQPEPAPATSVWDDLEAEESSKDNQVKALFEIPTKVDRKAAVLELARQTRAPADTIEQNYDGFLQAAEAAQFDPPTFRRENPHLVELLLEQPDVAPVVMRDPQVSALTKALRSREIEGLKEYISQVEKSPGLAGILIPPGASQNLSALGVKADRLGEAKTRLSQLQQAELDAVTPQPVRLDPAAKTEGAARLWEIPKAAFKSTQVGLERSKLGFQIMARKKLGQDTWDLEKQAVDLEQESGARSYGDTNFLEDLLVSAAEIAPSQLETLKGGGVGAVLGAGAAGGATLAATRNPTAARTAAGKGFRVGLGAGAALQSFELESGGAYLEFRDMKTDDGKTVDENVAIGAAVVYGAAAAGVEQAALGPFLKMAGPLGDAIVAGQGRAFMQGLMRDAGMRRILADAGKRWVKGAAAEAGEEAVQHIMQDVAAYSARAVSAGELQVAHPEVTLAEAGRVAAKTFAGTMVLGVPAAGVNVATQTLRRGKSERAGNQVSAILGMKDSPSVKASPELVAKLIERETGESGEAVTHLYVDPKAFTNLFQENRADFEAAANELLGEGGADRVREAINTGEKLEVPVEEYLEHWGPKEIAQRLAGDTTTRPGYLTTNELQKQEVELDAQAKAIAERVLAEEPANDGEVAMLDRLEGELKKAGEKRTSLVEPLRAFIATQSQVLGVSPEEFVQTFAVSARRGDGGTAGGTAMAQDPLQGAHPESHRLIREGIPKLDAAGRGRAVYADRTTGLLNQRAFDELPAPADKPFVAIVSVPNVKAINDDPDAGGHDKANGLFRMAAKALVDSGATAFKVGGDFRLYVKDQAELDAVLAQANAAMPVKAGQLVGALGESAEKADLARTEKIEGMRAAKQYPERGALSDELAGRLGEIAFPEDLASIPVPPNLEQRAAALPDDELFSTAFIEATGALTKEGWESIPRKPFVASLDLSGLKVANSKMGKLAGNDVIAGLSATAVAIGGYDLDFAHLSGDEYAIQAETQEEVTQFVELLRQAAKATAIISDLSNGGIRVYDGLEFWDGVGPTYDEADRNLNRLKRDRQNAGEVRGGEDRVKEFSKADSREVEAAYRRRAADELGRAAEAWRAARKSASDSAEVSEVDQTDTPAFKAWFKESKVIDENGKPRVVFHGTGYSGFDAFDKERQDDSALKGPGFYFTEDPSIASEYPEKAAKGQERGDSPGVYPVYLSIQNPFDESAAPAELAKQLKRFKAKAPPTQIKKMIDSAFREDASILSLDGVGAWIDNTEWAYRIADAAGKNGDELLRPHFDYILKKSLDSIVKQIQSGDLTSGQEVFKALEEIESNVDGTGVQEVLKRLGYDGVTHIGGNILGQGKEHRVWIAFDPEQIKSSTGNRGTFDSNDPNILHQEEDGDAPRGFVQMSREAGKRLFDIVLNKNADVSTFLHESGHVFLELMADLAERPDAPERVKNDWVETLKWLGVESREGIQKDQHEKWARAFEAYLLEGKAPSAKLVRVFQRFKLWLKQIYRSVASLNVEINDDIRGVFDRLLATDEEIQRMQGSMGLTPLFRSPAEAGMSPEEWEQYLEEQEDAVSAATTKAERRILEDKLRETEKWWKEEQRAYLEDARKDYELLPSVKNWRFFRQGEAADPALRAIIDQERERVISTQGGKVSAKTQAKITKLRKRIAALAKALGSRRAYMVFGSDPESGGLSIQRYDGSLEGGELRPLDLPRWLSVDEFLEERQVWEWTWSALKDGPKADEQHQKLVARYMRRALEEFPISEFGIKQGWTVAQLLEGKGGKKYAGLRRELEQWASLPDGVRADDPIPEKTWGALIDTVRKSKTAVSTSRFVNFKKVEVLDGWLRATKVELDRDRPDYASRPPTWYGAPVAENEAREPDRSAAKDAELEALYEEEGKLKEEAAAEAKAGVNARPKLSFDAVAATLGKGALELKGLTAEPGINPDDIAGLVGFTTGAELVQDLAKGPPAREAWVKERADAIMRERHPDILDEKERLTDMVGQALHGAPTAQWLLREWKALRSKAAQGVGGPPIEAVKRAAALIAEKRQIGPLNPHRALQAERAAANEAAVLAAKGEFAQAYVAKQKQILNHYVYKELVEARDEREKLIDFARKYTKDNARARLGKASPAYRDGMDSILEALELKEPEQRERPPLGLDALERTMEQNGDSIMFDVDAIAGLLADPKPWRQLTVAEMRNVFAALKNIRQSAISKTKALVEGRLLDREDVVVELVADAEKHLPDRGPAPSSVAAMSYAQKTGAALASFDGELLRPETMLGWLAGGDLKSMWYRAIVLPLQEAKAREADLLKSAIKPVVDAFKAIPKSVQARMMDQVDGAKLFPGHRQDIAAPTRRFELLSMALNFGNASNKQRLLEGRNITHDEAVTALQTLTKEEWDWVQSVWDASDSLWPLARELEERDSGLAPPKIEPTPVETPHGVYRGGYFPAVYDRRVSQTGERQAANALADMLDPSYTRPGTPHSHLKARAKDFADVISLDPSIIQSHLAQVAHDIAFRETLKSVGGLILDDKVEGALKRRLGDERASLFVQWLKDIGQMRAAQIGSHAKGLNRLVRAIRSNTAIAVLGYAADVALGDIANIAVGATVLKKKHWAAGLVDFLKAPNATRAFALERSGELRYREDSLAKDMAEQIKRLTGKEVFGKGALGWYRRHAFTFMEWSDNYTATPIWLGAYRQAAAEGKSERDAATFADATVRKIFPSHSAVDQSAILRDKGFVGSSLLFFGYMNTLYNRQRDIVHELYTAANADGAKGVALELPQVTGQLMALWAASSVIAEFLTGRGPEDDEEWYEWFLRKTLLTPFATLPWIGGPIEGLVLGKKPSVRAAPLYSVLDSAGKSIARAWQGDADGEKIFFELTKSLGLVFGVPVRPLRAAQYVTDVAQGEREPRGPLDVAGGLIYGERDNQPMNPASAVQDLVSGE